MKHFDFVQKNQKIIVGLEAFVWFLETICFLRGLTIDLEIFPSGLNRNFEYQLRFKSIARELLHASGPEPR